MKRKTRKLLSAFLLLILLSGCVEFIVAGTAAGVVGAAFMNDSASAELDVSQVRAVEDMMIALKRRRSDISYYSFREGIINAEVGEHRVKVRFHEKDGKTMVNVRARYSNIVPDADMAELLIKEMKKVRK